MMDAIEALEIWQASRRLLLNAKTMVRMRWLQFKGDHRLFSLRYRSERR